MKCTCDPNKNYFGRYETCITELFPFGTDRYPIPYTKPVDIDSCIHPEIMDLWSKGIQTIESCCGHNRVPAYIWVIDEHRQSMIDFGYTEIRKGEFNSLTIQQR